MEIVSVAGPSSAASRDQPHAPIHPITKEAVQKLCVEQGFYRTPSCNDKLYLHHKGFDEIAGLDEFTECKVLWLEGNAFRKIEGLQQLTKLKQLYLHQNLIYTIEGLEALTELDGLNLSDNNISFLSGLDAQADSLTTLQIKNNRLGPIEGLTHLATLRKLSCLDLSGNRIEDGEALLTLLAEIPDLRSLHLTGNPCVRSIKNYRKTVLSRLPTLLGLDEKPVFADERRLVTAWAAGGVEGERAERAKMREEEQAKVERRLEEFRELQRRAQEARGQPADAPTDEDTDSEPSADSSGDDDGDVWVAPGATPSNTASNVRSSSVSSAANSDAPSSHGTAHHHSNATAAPASEHSP